MPLSGNAIDNNVLTKLANRAGPVVTSAIQQASLKTGVNFAYLMEKAAAESSFDTDAGSKSSSAKGLYQFIGSTWLQMIDRYGDKYGLEKYADAIDKNGKVRDPAMRKEILALRDDPEISAFMAGEFAAENKQSLIRSGIKEKDIGSTELYLAHFLGAGAASEFLKAQKHNPLQAAADIFPSAARANHNVFYTKTQHARSIGEVYAFFDKKFSNSGNITPAQVETLVAGTNAAQAEKATPRYAANSILRTLPMAGADKNMEMMTALNDDNQIDMNDFVTTYRAPLQSIALAAPRNSLISDPATLMMLAAAHTPTATTANETAKTVSHHKDEKPAQDKDAAKAVGKTSLLKTFLHAI